jgi:hypothetical protein
LSDLSFIISTRFDSEELKYCYQAPVTSVLWLLQFLLT